jgi:hypothetical protein
VTYIIYCDESADKGPKYCDFFGGCIINSEDEHEIRTALEAKKKELNLLQEIKWTKVTEQYLEKYIEIIDLFFEFVKAGKIKVRIMFRSVDDTLARQVESQVDDKYFKLYYQFIKHSFGLMHIPPENTPAKVILYLDTLPDKHGIRDRFKEYLASMPNTHDFKDVDLSIRMRDIIEVDSREHVLMQCTDIVLGSMNFKLNGFNKLTHPETGRRGKRTIAKEKLFKHIQEKIWEIYPRFNIGVSTGQHEENQHWSGPYEHWVFHRK